MVVRPGLEVRAGHLRIAGRDAEELARSHGTPLYVHDLQHVAEQATALRDTIEGAGLQGVVRLALKAQRDPDLLRFLREHVPFVGMDVCSPGELEWAMRRGWHADEISYTGTNLSDRDLEPHPRQRRSPERRPAVLSARSGLVDALRPGVPLWGIRVNPGIGDVPPRRARDVVRGRPADEVRDRARAGLDDALRDRAAAPAGESSRCTTTRATCT